MLNRIHRFDYKLYQKTSDEKRCQVKKYSLKNRPYEVLRGGLAGGQVTSIPTSVETIRKNWVWARAKISLTGQTI